MADVSEPAPTTAIPCPRRQGHCSARRGLESEIAEDEVQPQRIHVAEAHMTALPGRRHETPRRLAEDLGEDPLPALEDPSSVFGIQSGHLVGAPGDQRGRAGAAQTLMEVPVQKKFRGALFHEPAVVRVCRERPATLPVRNHSKGDATPEKWREIAEHHPSLPSVGRSCVVDADDEASRHGAAWMPPYRRSRASNASTASARSASVKSGHRTSVK